MLILQSKFHHEVCSSLTIIVLISKTLLVELISCVYKNIKYYVVNFTTIQCSEFNQRRTIISTDVKTRIVMYLKIGTSIIFIF